MGNTEGKEGKEEKGKKCGVRKTAKQQVEEWLSTILCHDVILLIFSYAELPLAGILLASFGSFGHDKAHFYDPNAIISDGTQLYICDTNNHRVQVFNLDTESWVATIGSQGGGRLQFQYPRGLLLANQHIYVSDFWNRRIVVVHRTGSYTRHLDLLFRCGGLASYGSELFVADLEHSRVVVYSLCSRQAVRSWGRKGITDVPGAKDPPFNASLNLAVDHEYVYVTDFGGSRLRLFDHAGKLVKFIGKNLFSYPSAVYLYEDDLYVGDSSSVRIYQRGGGVLKQTIGGSGGSGGGAVVQKVSGLLRVKEKLYVLDGESHRVQIFG